MYGGSKVGEYWRTIEMLMQKTGKTKEEVMYILYFLYDSSYEGKDLKAMAELIQGTVKA